MHVVVKPKSDIYLDPPATLFKPWVMCKQTSLYIQRNTVPEILWSARLYWHNSSVVAELTAAVAALVLLILKTWTLSVPSE